MYVCGHQDKNGVNPSNGDVVAKVLPKTSAFFASIFTNTFDASDK